MQLQLVERVPTVGEYLTLRASVGWYALAEAPVRLALKNSLFAITAIHGPEAVGCGRVTGDGGIYFYVQDLITHPRYQRQGVATGVMERLMAYVNATSRRGAFVGLMAAPGLEGFYSRFGFSRFPNESPGMGIWR
jgi:GNAT superfamily N-acetyltransferase